MVHGLIADFWEFKAFLEKAEDHNSLLVNASGHLVLFALFIGLIAWLIHVDFFLDELLKLQDRVYYDVDIHFAAGLVDFVRIDDL